MSRSKSTIRQRGRVRAEPHPSRVGAWIGEYAKPTDAKLPADLQDIVQTWRCFYDDREMPARSDIRRTLRDLVSIGDDEARAAVLVMDGFTEAQLATAALRAYRREHPQPAAVPD